MKASEIFLGDEQSRKENMTLLKVMEMVAHNQNFLATGLYLLWRQGEYQVISKYLDMEDYWVKDPELRNRLLDQVDTCGAFMLLENEPQDAVEGFLGVITGNMIRVLSGTPTQFELESLSVDAHMKLVELKAQGFMRSN